MNDNNFPNQQGFDPNQGYNPQQNNPQQGYNPYQQMNPQQGYNGPQQVYPDQGYPQYQYPSQSSAEANKGVSGGKIVLIVLGIVVGLGILFIIGMVVLFNVVRNKTRAAIEEVQSNYSFDSENLSTSDEELNEAIEELKESLEQLATDESFEELQDILNDTTNTATSEDATEEKSVTSSDEVVFTKDYFTSYQWEGINDPALIIPESDDTFIWYRDMDDKEGDYYSGTYKLYIGDEAVTYLTTEAEEKDSITEQDIIDMEAPEYGATRENFVCLVLTNEVECFYGQETTYPPEDQITSNLYGYFVNDKDGYKLTLVKYDNPYEFNLVPKEKED